MFEPAQPRGEERDERRVEYPSGVRHRFRIVNIDDDPEWHAVATGKKRLHNL